MFRSYGNYIENNICILFSVFFWKCIEFHWMFKSEKTYYLPDIPNNNIKYKWLPTNNNNERIDKYVDMNWTKIWTILEFMNNKKFNLFLKAWYFYKQALININYDIEIAYIDLIRCIEILSDFTEQKDDSWTFFDWSLKKIYDKIKDDKKLTKFFIKYHWTTKKFYTTILHLLSYESNFWKQTESIRPSFWLLYLKQNRKKIEDILKRTYDLRSEYIHNWLTFWSFILPEKEWLNELVHSQPVVNEGNKIKIQENLSFLWLERIVRNCLINYITKN